MHNERNIQLIMSTGLSRTEAVMLIDIERHFADQIAELYLRTITQAPEELRKAVSVILARSAQQVGSMLYDQVKTVLAEKGYTP